MMDIDTTAGDVITSTFDNLPSGWYLAHAIEGTCAPKGGGTQLNLTWEILEGQFEKRRVWQREWAAHSSPQSQEIGQRMIRTIGQAVGVGKVERPEDLMFKPVEIRVGLTKKEDGYEQRNEVKSARKHGAGASVGAAAPAAGAPASTPWGKKAA
jgi:hypothetical protein